MICQTCGQPVVEIIDYDFEPTGNYVHESEGFDHLVRPIEED